MEFTICLKVVNTCWFSFHENADEDHPQNYIFADIQSDLEKKAETVLLRKFSQLLGSTRNDNSVG